MLLQGAAVDSSVYPGPTAGEIAPGSQGQTAVLAGWLHPAKTKQRVMRMR
jgi:hypothetical protein